MAKSTKGIFILLILTLLSAIILGTISVTFYIKMENRKVTFKQEIDNYNNDLKEIKNNAEETVNNLKESYNIKIRDQKRSHYKKKRVQEKMYQDKISNLILKYNPDFTNTKIIGIINTESDDLPVEVPVVTEYPVEFSKRGFMTKEDFLCFQKILRDQHLLIKRVGEIPYEKSVSTALTKIASMNNIITEKYEKLWKRMLETINNYSYTFKYLYIFSYKEQRYSN